MSWAWLYVQYSIVMAINSVRIDVLDDNVEKENVFAVINLLDFEA